MGGARGSQRDVCQPGVETGQVDRRGRQHMLQAGFGQANIPGPSKPQRSYALREGSLDASPLVILFFPLWRGLPLACRLQRFIFRLEAEGQLARLRAGMRAQRSHRTGPADRVRKLDADHGMTSHIPGEGPLVGDLSLRTGDCLGFPMDCKVGQVIA